MRHGHVDGISPPRFRGRAELPLTNHGVQQAAATRDYLSTFVRPAVIYSSPLSRCIRTGEILGQPYSQTPRPLPAFSDIDYGAWQGRTFEDIQKSEPETFAQWHRTPHLTAIPSGETLYEVASRVAGVLRMIVSRHGGETVLLVGHDSVNRVLLLLALDQPLSRYWWFKQSPCGVSVLEHGGAGDWTIASLNETAHLGSLARPPPGS